MSKTIIGEDAFPEIVRQYNSDGRTSHMISCGAGMASNTHTL